MLLPQTLLFTLALLGIAALLLHATAPARRRLVRWQAHTIALFLIGGSLQPLLFYALALHFSPDATNVVRYAMTALTAAGVAVMTRWVLAGARLDAAADTEQKAAAAEESGARDSV